MFLTYSRTFTKIFGFFPLKSKFWNVDNIENWKRFDLYTKNSKKTQNFYSKSLERADSLLKLVTQNACEMSNVHYPLKFIKFGHNFWPGLSENLGFHNF